jgi:hypothetical protein
MLGNLLQQQVHDANAAQQADRAPKTFSIVYPQAAIELQLLCEAVTEEALPPIWLFLLTSRRRKPW